MGLKARLKDYKSEMVGGIFLALILIILLLALNLSFDLTRNESFILDLLISLVGLIISVVIILRKTIELSLGPMEDILSGINKIIEILTRPTPEELPATLKRLLEMEKEDYAKTYECLAKGGRYFLQKREVYQKLTAFTAAVSAENSNDILTVSSVDLSDFEKDSWAGVYLDVTVDSVKRGVSVKRVFLLSDANIRNGDFVRLIKRHGEKISNACFFSICIF